ncbi:hypothetical protein [Chitinophaga sp. YIM B06452]|uniref:hypothetical protein n=1 Tax=Chitinophaga sp. YIM B06452 TaxID=3082158 RepID=UPI0031FE93BA
MWTSLTAFGKLIRQHNKQWSGLMHTAAFIFFVIGVLAGGVIISVLGMVFMPEENLTDPPTYLLSNSLRCGCWATVIGCGLTAAAFSRNSTAPGSFAELSRQTPKVAWLRFISLSLLQILFVFIGMYLTFKRSAAFASEGLQTADRANTYYLWAMNFTFLLTQVTAAAFAGIVFIKGAGAASIAPYRGKLAILMVTGFILASLITSVFYDLHTILLSPVLFSILSLPGGEYSSAVVIALFTLLTAHIWTWLICSAFYEEEIEFELEEETKVNVHK